MQPGERRRAGERQAERRQRRDEHGPELLPHVGQRQRDADEGDRPDGAPAPPRRACRSRSVAL